MAYAYDDLHRLTREASSPAQGSYRTAYDYRYTYDAVGNRNMKYDYSTGYLGRQEEYSYSARNELTQMDEFCGFRGQDTKFAVIERLTAGAADASVGTD